ncbi:unnamed protein product [Camellia sinensis]
MGIMGSSESTQSSSNGESGTPKKTVASVAAAAVAGVVLVGSGLAMLASSSGSEEQKGNDKLMVAPDQEGPLTSLGQILRMTQLVISATIVLRVEDEQLGLMGFDRDWDSFVVLFFLKLWFDPVGLITRICIYMVLVLAFWPSIFCF